MSQIYVGNTLSPGLTATSSPFGTFLSPTVVSSPLKVDVPPNAQPIVEKVLKGKSPLVPVTIYGPNNAWNIPFLVPKPTYKRTIYDLYKCAYIYDQFGGQIGGNSQDGGFRVVGPGITTPLYSSPYGLYRSLNHVIMPYYRTPRLHHEKLIVPANKESLENAMQYMANKAGINITTEKEKVKNACYYFYLSNEETGGVGVPDNKVRTNIINPISAALNESGNCSEVIGKKDTENIPDNKNGYMIVIKELKKETTMDELKKSNENFKNLIESNKIKSILTILYSLDNDTKSFNTSSNVKFVGNPTSQTDDVFQNNVKTIVRYWLNNEKDSRTSVEENNESFARSMRRIYGQEPRQTPFSWRSFWPLNWFSSSTSNLDWTEF